jgi:alkylation response protein AidB-like acyl-CoA dehydrogenase
VERWARFVRAMRLYEGTSEILKTNIARTLGLDEPVPVPAPAAAAGPAPTP